MNMVALWVRTTEAARRLGMHENTLRRIPPEDLPFMLANSRGDRRYHRDDIDRYIYDRMVRVSPPKVVGVSLINGKTGPLKTTDTAPPMGRYYVLEPVHIYKGEGLAVCGAEVSEPCRDCAERSSPTTGSPATYTGSPATSGPPEYRGVVNLVGAPGHRYTTTTSPEDGLEYVVDIEEVE